MKQLKLWVAVLAVIAIACVCLLPNQSTNAGAPPPSAIPWDTTSYIDTVDGTATIVVVEFITRQKYEREMWGRSKAAQVDELERDLEQIKKAIKAKRP